ETATANGSDHDESAEALRDDDPRRRRRGRRGGRRNRRGREGEGPQPASDAVTFQPEFSAPGAPQPDIEPALERHAAEPSTEPSAEPWQRDREHPAEQHPTAAPADYGSESMPAAQQWQQPEPAAPSPQAEAAPP